jgi:alpha-L-rhamnosidase
VRITAVVLALTLLMTASRAVTLPAGSPRVSGTSELKVNRLRTPLAVDSRQPLFSWIVKSDRRGDAYRIIVSSTKDKAEKNQGDLWASGKTLSCEQSDMLYAGAPLKSTTEYFWRVCTWRTSDPRGAWSDVARFTTGYLSSREWRGTFIGGRDLQLFRKEFTVESTRTIARARLYLGSLGVPVIYVNGRKAGNSVLNSSDAVIKKTIWYQGYEATELLRQGANAVGVMMGLGQLGKEYGTPDSLKFIMNLVIDYSDGSRQVVSSDSTWKATPDGPLVRGESNNFCDGEKYDARAMPKGWTEPSFDDHGWASGNVLSITQNTATLKAELTPPMMVVEEIRPQYVSELSPGVFIVDALRNQTGWAEISMDGTPGEKVELRFAEELSTLWNDYSVDAAVTIVNGAAGVLFRCVDDHNYYYWKLTTTGKIVAQKTINGVTHVMKEIPVVLAPGKEYRIKIQAIGKSINTYCDSSMIDALSDSTFASGKVGFKEEGSDTARFRSIKVVNETSQQTLLETSGKNPSLWLNNKGVTSLPFGSSGAGQLEITRSDYVVSVFGNVNGGIDQSSLSISSFAPDVMGTGAMQYDYYIHGGDGVETWEPFQTLHGFRYIEVKGMRGFTRNNIRIKIVRQAVDQREQSTFRANPCSETAERDDNIGSFSSSNQLLKDLYKASLSSITSALQWGIPAACVSRDERNGWTGDAECTSQAANYFADMESFYKQWFIDIRETQHSDGYIDNLAPRQGERASAIEEDIPWSSGGINVPWDTYLASGDKSIIREHYDAMRRFIDWCIKTSNYSAGSKEVEDFTTNKDCWGDWTSLLEKGACCPESRPEGSLFATAFFYNSALRLSLLAAEIGKVTESRELNLLASKIQYAYNRKFLKEDSMGVYYIGDSQSANAISLAFGLCPAEKKSELLERLVRQLEQNDYTLTVGVLGLYTIFDALCDNGRTDVAYRMVSKRTYPSWGYWMKQGGYWLAGATSMWEFWDGHGSHNHMFLGGKMNAFLVKNLAGISARTPGYGEVRIKPGVVGNLTDAKASVFSPKGRIEVDWMRDNTDDFTLKALIPVNSTAEVHIPMLGNRASDLVIVEGKTEIYKKGVPASRPFVAFEREADGYVVFKVGSGSYEFHLRKE